MALLPFCFWSAFFFMVPSLALLSISGKRWFIYAISLANLVLLGFAVWLFPQISRESLAFSALMFNLYCYLVLLLGIVIGSVVKAIEMKAYLFIPFIFLSVLIVNVTAILYSNHSMRIANFL